jgi:putative lipoprotein
MRVFTSLAVGTLFCGGAAVAHGNDSFFTRDKAEHFALSAGLSAAGYAAGAVVFETTEARLLTGAGLALTLGAAKELDDLRGPGVASWADMTWNVVGTAGGLLLAYGVDRLVTYLMSPRAAPLQQAHGVGVLLRF